MLHVFCIVTYKNSSTQCPLEEMDAENVKTVHNMKLEKNLTCLSRAMLFVVSSKYEMR